MTENNGIYFTELSLKNVRCFGDEAVLKLCNDKGEWTRWNIILGDNGTGKTTLLQCLAFFELVPVYEPNDQIHWVPKFSLSNQINLSKLGNSYKPIYITKLHLPVRFKIDASVISAENKKTKISCFQTEGISLSSSSIVTDSLFSHIDILGYGANRRVSFNQLSPSEIENNNSATLFDEEAKLINAEEWLLQMEFAASRDSEIKEQAKKRSSLIKDVLKNILPDVDDLRFRDSNNISKPVPTLEFKTPYGWVGLKELSYGYKTMVAWIVDVAARMFKRYPDSDNPLEEPVVILVDEIDLHLHPKWQRQIFDFLESRFPRAQFVVTAHSPLIVQSAPKDANIIVLRKEQQGNEFVVKIENDRNYVRNWRVDQILASDLFDNVGIRNEEVEQQMQERTTLLQKDVLTEPEKVRLDELNAISDSLPTANNPIDIEAMDIIRRAAEELKKRGGA